MAYATVSTYSQGPALQSSFAEAGSIVVARNAGLTVADLETLRVQMKQAGGNVKVAKNRLAKLALKDMRLATEASNEIGRTLPMLEAVREGLNKAVVAGLGEKDWSIMADMTVRGNDSLVSYENKLQKKQ